MRCYAGSQSRDMMAWKRTEASRLLGRGLTVAQVSAQLHCSRAFVRRLRDERPEASEAQGEPALG